MKLLTTIDGVDRGDGDLVFVIRNTPTPVASPLVLLDNVFDLYKNKGYYFFSNREAAEVFLKSKYMNVISIAKVAHEINKAYCESIGDNSQPSWDEAPEWQRSSAINGVNFHLADPSASPSASHESWLKQKTEEGWKYGPTKNPETKEHPCFVPYDELPVSQRSKDFLFKQIVHSLAPFIGETNRV